MADTYYTCNLLGECYETRWHSWGRWVFISFMTIGLVLLLAMCLTVSARRRRLRGEVPLRGTGWLAPKSRFVAQPGPPGPAGYYPPHQTPYTPPPYSPYPMYSGTTAAPANPHANYYAPPPGPPPAHTYRQEYEMHSNPPSSLPTVPVSSHPTGSSYVQTNNPFQPVQIATPPPVHVDRKE